VSALECAIAFVLSCVVIIASGCLGLLAAGCPPRDILDGAMRLFRGEDV
jgi:hypothetical protein